MPDLSMVVTTLVAFLVVVTLVLVGLAVLLSRRHERERRALLATWAQARDWSAMFGRVDVPWIDRLPGRDPAGIRMLFTGIHQGRRVSVAEYAHKATESSLVGHSADDEERDPATQAHVYTVCVIHLRESYPPVEVVRRGTVSRFWRRHGREEQVHTGDPEFDDRYRVRSRDPAVVPTLVGPALMSAHLADSVPTWSLAGHDLLAFWSGRLTIGGIDTYLDALLGVADLLGR